MLWAEALPLVSTIHLLLSTASSHGTLADSPLGGKGKLQDDAVAWGCGCGDGSGSGNKKASGLNSAKGKCNYHNCVSKFLFHSWSSRQSMEMQMLR